MNQNYQELSDNELLDSIGELVKSGIPIDGFLVSGMVSEAESRGLEIPKLSGKNYSEVTNELISSGERFDSMPQPENQPHRISSPNKSSKIGR